MSEPIFSTYWYHVAKLKPVLRNTTVITRHVYRGEPWYILRNSLSNSNHRFNVPAYGLIGQMDGQKTVQEIWENAASLSADDAPTQDESIRLLARLHDADLVQSDILPSVMESVRQLESQSKTSLKQQVSNPFSIRIPFFDPDRFLEKCQFLTNPLFTLPVFILWLFIVLGAFCTAIVNKADLLNSFSDQIYTVETLLMLWVIYPMVKTMHEFGHAFAVKKWGGEVHEMGVILIALTPIPFVDAGASAAFSEKRHRLAVAAMGIMVELLLAAIALFIWLNVETGFISGAAYCVMLIGGISTVLFNGNPLLRYDGYYMLSDLLEIPNLSQRSTAYLGYLVQRYILRIDAAESPVTASGEKFWFLIYGPLSFCYRILVVVWLIWLFSDRFFFIGILIALWGLFGLLVLPTLRKLVGFLSLPAAKNKRFALLTACSSALLGLALLVFVFPMPFWTMAQGVIWLPEQSSIRPGTDFEIVEIMAPTEQAVKKNDPLIKGADPFLESEIEVYLAQLKELTARYNALPLQKRVERRLFIEEIQRLSGDIAQAREKQTQLQVLSPAQGGFILIDADNLKGRFVKKGELLGYIVPDHGSIVRAVVQQADIGLVRNQLTGVEVRLAEQSEKLHKARVERIVPAADFNLPSAALGKPFGGNIPVDPTDPDGLRALDTIFQVDINLSEQIMNPHIGARAYIRFEHGTLPLGMQWYRKLRQVFLRKFYV